MPLASRGRTCAGRGRPINLLLGSRNPLDSETIKNITHPRPYGLPEFVLAPLVLVTLSPEPLGAGPVGVGKVLGRKSGVARIVKIGVRNLGSVGLLDVITRPLTLPFAQKGLGYEILEHR